MITMINQINEDKVRLTKLQSKYDLKVSNLYHEMETKNFNASEGFKKYKELQVILRERRIVKNELSSIQALLSTLNVKAFESQIHKSLAKVKKYDESNEKYTDGWNIGIADIMV
ncbi:hypothetical protein [Paenibacillus sp. JSM ZJ436]|uniref:hypothetical protein n=1 Tax=Paenibacillus sp. JSM ZJ436 TaxID=3376190 RepID=UPI0037CBCD78